MEKKWEKIAEGEYSFSINNSLTGRLISFPNTLESKATAQIGKNIFHICRIGFWKNTVQISDNSNLIIGKIYYEKWYSNSFIFELYDQKYSLVIRNNPLAEWAIIDKNGKELIAYGLNTNNSKVTVKITHIDGDLDPLFDFILWYLFAPIASENMGDDFLFMMLAVS